MGTNNTTQDPSIEPNLSEALEPTEDIQVKLDRPLREGDRRLLEVWNQLNEENDVAMMTAILLTGVHFFGYALTMSNSINGRQGKNRLTFRNENRRLIEVAEDDNIDAVQDKKLNDLFSYIIQTYLTDKQELPEGRPKLANGMMSRVKSLFIMLFATGQYGVIPKLTIPPYIQPMIDKTFDWINEEQDNILDNWIAYLEQHESQEIADLVRSLGRSFWGSDYVTPENIFLTKFQGMTHKFKDYAATYSAYLQFRGENIKVTRSIARNSLTTIFQMSDDQFNWYRKCIIDEFQHIFTEDENSVAIQKLIYEI